jgi:Zn-dependent M16 (insulinase) family peptidase
MRFGQSGAASYQDYNMYTLNSGTGISGFEEEFSALMGALFKPDFTDVEAEREFYHIGISSDATTGKKSLVEQGTVYNEEQTGQRIYDYYFALNKEVFGGANPFAFDIGGLTDEMRSVAIPEIRDFHSQQYRLGRGTGFIFVFPPKENVSGFLARISVEFRKLPKDDSSNSASISPEQRPKYPFTSAPTKEVNLYPFPSSNAADRGDVRLGWAPVKAESQVELRLLQLFMRILADGEQSLLYKTLVDSKNREVDSGATGIDTEVVLLNSAWFPAEFIGLRGIPGNRINVDRVEELRKHVLAKIEELSGYADNSAELLAFNRIVLARAKAWQRDQKVWIKSSPLFGDEYRTDWKEQFGYLEMNPSFVRSLSDAPVWQAVESQINSGKNLWSNVIRHFRLLETPYATASVPDTQLLASIELDRQKRIRNKVEELENTFGVSGEQSALSRYQEIESRKSAEIDRIDSRVARPRFSEHPPLTPDDGVEYKQFHLNNTPVIAVLFEGTPTIDLGLSFDLRKIPAKYHKYLPMLPRCFDSLGLKTPDHVISYSDLLAETQKIFSAFSIEYDSNPISKRADLSIRASTTSLQEMETALKLLTEIFRFSNLDVSNADRLRDLVDGRLAEEDVYNKGDDSSWFWNPADSFRHQDDALYIAVRSHFTQAHWDNRLKWLLHEPVSSEQLAKLGKFADQFLASSNGLSAKDLSAALAQLETSGLEKELVQYWQRNIAAFPEREVLNGFRRLTAEVQADLSVGPAQTMRELKELQGLIIHQGALRMDVTIDPSLLENVTPVLTRFLGSLPASREPSAIQRSDSEQSAAEAPILENVEKRLGASSRAFPWYVGFEDSQSATGGVAFSADFLDYSQVDRRSVIKLLSSKIVSGTGPQTLFMKTFESGLAYSNSVSSDPNLKLLSYYADRTPDIGALVQLVNSFTARIPDFHDSSLLDYILRKAFPSPRSTSTFTDRGKSLAQDIYNGNEPAKVRRFSEAILKLRNDPNLLSEIIRSGLPSIAPVLLQPSFREAQRRERSIFFMVGTERLLADAEKQLAIPKLIRLYASDFWIDDRNSSSMANRSKAVR